MTIVYYSFAKYTSSSGATYKGVITLNDDFLIFKNNENVIAEFKKEDISSFKISNNFLSKNISIRVNGKDYKFQTKNKSITQIIDFIKH